jgi:hypothetical protein
VHSNQQAATLEGAGMLATTRRRFGVGLALLPLASPAMAAPLTLEVWKMRGCVCCTAWARHFEAAGFGTTIHEVDDLGPVRAAAGVPEDLGGCHTAKVAGYVVEGHVPVAAVQRMLTERPAIIGLAVPGMPMNSPGMEIEGEQQDPFDVIAFAADGSRSVFMEVRL